MLSHKHYIYCSLNLLISNVLHAEEDNWLDYATALWHKKNKKQIVSPIEIQKQKQFLLYRGFSPDIISQLMNVLT